MAEVQQLNLCTVESSLVIFLDTKKCRLTFDLLGLSKQLSPFSTGPFDYNIEKAVWYKPFVNQCR